uniref:Uncharacterized protein n=1 Tax=Strombidium rassoulzadegani TaxID=1082188 RepID=A0A7S3CUD5_9SPIT|mmetsp:Transcript_9302/g.15676  ORF Transcript_9302/g.15676 Transcript_9302/m.15676 type:complete len:176 (+) Transcript_9302:7-534(+)
MRIASFADPMPLNPSLSLPAQLSVQATQVNEYKNLQATYDWFIAFQSIGIAAGSVALFLQGEIEIGIALIVLNVLDWNAIDFIKEEANLILAGEGTDVHLGNAQIMLRTFFSLFPVSVVGFIIMLNLLNPGATLLTFFIGSVIVFSALDFLLIFQYLIGVDELLKVSGYPPLNDF